jgi:diguanylate cyclase (GGDEF)-like protein
MKIKDLILYKPYSKEKIILKIIAISSVFLIGYLHYIAGPLFEFHLFFFIPIIIASWFTSQFFSYLILLLVIVSWTIGDYLIVKGTVNLMSFAFNALMHALIIIYLNYLLGYIRQLLIKESQLAREDSLTKIPNRRGFYEYGETAFSTADRHQLPIASIFIDLDDFKSINDTYGHKTGDQLLYETAQVIKDSIRKTDVAGRLGGDEFCIILLNVDSKQAKDFSESLRNKLNEKMQQQGWKTTFSMGIVSYGSAPKNFHHVIQRADNLMYQVKRNGRNGFIQESHP